MLLHLRLSKARIASWLNPQPRPLGAGAALGAARLPGPGGMVVKHRPGKQMAGNSHLFIHADWPR